MAKAACGVAASIAHRVLTMEMFNKRFGQQKLEFDEVEVVKEIKNQNSLPDFNKKLKTALNHNPKDKED